MMSENETDKVTSGDFAGPSRLALTLWSVWFWIALVVLVAVATGLVVKHHRSQTAKNGVAFVIDHQKFTQSTVRNLAAYPIAFEHLSIKDAAKKIYGLEQYRVAAEKTGIYLSDAELTQFRQNRGDIIYMQKSQRNFEQYLNLVAYKGATEQRLLQAGFNQAEGSYSGYSFIFHFDESLNYGPFGPPGGGSPNPHFGDKAMLARDKKYALQRANYYHTQLVKKAMTPDKALAEVKSDARLALAYQHGVNDSIKFGEDPAQSWQHEVANDSISDYISKQSKTGLSNVQTGQITQVFDLQNLDTKKVDGYYYFVLLTKAQPSAPNLKQALQNNLTQIQKNSIYYGVKNG